MSDAGEARSAPPASPVRGSKLGSRPGTDQNPEPVRTQSQQTRAETGIEEYSGLSGEHAGRTSGQDAEFSTECGKPAIPIQNHSAGAWQKNPTLRIEIGFPQRYNKNQFFGGAPSPDQS